jgi:hypothetical protein
MLHKVTIFCERKIGKFDKYLPRGSPCHSHLRSHSQIVNVMITMKHIIDRAVQCSARRLHRAIINVLCTLIYAL